LGPIVLSSIDEQANIMEEEIFGPILPIKTYSTLEEVIDYVNARPKPLALYFFSSSKIAINKITRETTAGSMCINDCVLQFSHPELPFGGVNNSGIGKAHGHFGFLAFSNEKSLLRQRKGLTMAKTLYPPFDSLKRTTLNFLLKYF
jgi:aldehyde dehydrogenase (NAD+)